MPEIIVKRFSRDKSIQMVDNLMNNALNAPNDVKPIETIESRELIQTEEECFLAELHNDKFVSEIEMQKQEKEKENQEKEKLKQQKQDELEVRKEERLRKKREAEEKKIEKAEKDKEKEKEKEAKKNVVNIIDDDGNETVLYGKDRWMLIRKFEQYKVLFPDNDNIKKLKMKKKATLEDLQQLVEECNAIIETDTVEVFMTDAILTSVKAVEFASIRTRYNLKGLSEMLRENNQFNLLIKQLYLKYKVFAKMPVEIQLMMVVGTSAWICIEKNKKELADEKFVNKTVNIDDFN